MKSTGIVRKVDELGRIVLPIELRRTLDIAEKDSLEIYVDESTIVLKKYEPACIFCDNAKNIINYKGKNICPDCMQELKNRSVQNACPCKCVGSGTFYSQTTRPGSLRNRASDYRKRYRRCLFR